MRLALVLLAAILALPADAQAPSPLYGRAVTLSAGGAHRYGVDAEWRVRPALAVRAGLGLEGVYGFRTVEYATAVASVRALGSVGSGGLELQAGPGLALAIGRRRAQESSLFGQSRQPMVVPSLYLGSRLVLSGGQTTDGRPAPAPHLALRVGVTTAYDIVSGADFLVDGSESAARDGLDDGPRRVRLRPEVGVGFAF
ncbi:hypothetical protein [Rubrivirga sp. IMCC43871]|uniref:hypothetical protein n=1 Tax=Rubrivirga sp. IMCC43871 TaxID=3391575 RepID=UPI00398F91E1